MNDVQMNAADTDASLLAASQAGDVHAFGFLIERYHNLVCAIAYSRTGDRIASEDLAQETFLAAWKSIGTLRETEKLRAWLCGITRNVASKSRRGRRPEDDIAEHEGQLAGDAGPLDAILSKETETTVWSALSQLPETYREPLVLFYREEKSIKEVALALGLSEDTAKQRLSRGRQQLKDNLSDLVEQTLRKGRPNKAAAAAVLAAIIASGAKPALASTLTNAAPRSKLRAGALALGGVAAVASVAVYLGSTGPSPAKSVETPDHHGAARRACSICLERVADVPSRRLGGRRRWRSGCWGAGRGRSRGCHAAAGWLDRRHRRRRARTTDRGRKGQHGHLASEHHHPGSLAARIVLRRLPVVSDAAGRFVLRGIPPGRAQLVARGPTFASATPVALDLTLAENRSGITITGASARTLTGFVVARGTERQGLANVRVLAIEEGAPFSLPVSATSDSSGYFELSGLRPGRYRIAAAVRELVPHVGADVIEVADSALAETLVVLDRGVPVRGRVDAKVRPDVSLRLAGQGGSAFDRLRVSLMRAEVDEGGSFTLPAVAPGRYIVTATTIDGRGETTIDVGTSPPSAVSIQLAARPTISGEVVDDQGTKLAGVLVEATPTRPSDPFAAMHTTVRTDASGAFRIVGVEPGRYRLRVFDASGQRAWANDARRPFKGRVVEAPANESLVMTSRGGTLTGLVVDALGKPVADAWIEVRARDAQRVPPLFAVAPILTDAAGRFSITGVFGAELVVEASAPDGQARAITKAAPGAQVELVLRPLATITADVTAQGARVEAFDLRVRNTQTETTTAARGAAGQATVSAIAGEHELVVTSDRGYAQRSLTVGRAPSANVAVELAPWGALRGRVVTKDGSPCANASLFVRETVEPTLARTDARGAFSIDRVIAGRNELTILCGIDGAPISDFHFELQRGQQLDAGTIDASVAHSTNARTSADLGLGFYVSASTPTPAQIVAVARDSQAAEIDGDDPSAGLWIVEVVPGSPAAAAGLSSGDRVTAVGLGTVENGRGAVAMMKSLSTPWRSKGRAVTWKIVRGTRALSVPVLVP